MQWAPASYLPYLLPLWPSSKGGGRGGRTSPTRKWCQLSTSASDVRTLSAASVTSSQGSGAWQQNLTNMQVMSLWTSASDLLYLLPWWPPPKGAKRGGRTSPASRWCQWWTSASDLPYLLPWWPPPKEGGRGGRTSPASRWCQWWTSASDLPYLLPWWPPPKGAECGGSTSPTCRRYYYKLLLMIYLMCCLGDLLPREWSMAAGYLQHASDIIMNFC